MIRPPAEFATKGELYGGGNGGQAGIYDLADNVSDTDFEGAVAEAKDECNLSRANLARKIRQRRIQGQDSAGEPAPDSHAPTLTHRPPAPQLGSHGPGPDFTRDGFTPAQRNLNDDVKPQGR